ncbi:DUF7287 family protein [Halogeometricum luteum]|uniref:Uncharacterized protein n=1 Tax=Halogeometricum luteum TaxID=2950537 RepID=A0ABU2FX78_9EURY|nr:hypothetical protein [Halogeometricum sp. S3BR5-2]MDS0293144.1 hypothetical protein [Halogeometricum sp. S3BR5-2]
MTSLAADDRAQTVQDFTLGISVFLLAAATTFAFVPAVYAPFDTPVESGDAARAERIAIDVRERITDESGVRVDADASDAFFDAETAASLRATYGLAPRKRVSVELVGAGARAGDDYAGEPTASVTRVVTGPGAECDPSCSLVVRVW